LTRLSHSQATPRWQLVTAFAFGAIFLVVILLIAVLHPNPTDFQLLVYRVALALAAAGVGAVMPGTINVSGFLRAGGAIVLFVIVYLLNPPEFFRSPSPPAAQVRISTPSIDVRPECDQAGTVRAKVTASSFPGYFYAMVQPVTTQAWYVHGPCSLASGVLRCNIELGEPTTPCGTVYEIVLVARRAPLTPGGSAIFPSNLEAQSEPLRIVR